MDRKKYNNSNAGMTLLEVIVAVSIFSITAIVLLQSFVTSGRINKKSNTYMEATTVAQNIMEEIKAKKFEEVSLAFNYPVDSTGYTRLNFLNTQVDKVLNGTLGIKEVLQSKDESENAVYKDVSKYREGVDEKNITASVISKDNGKTYEFNARKSGENASKYFFELTNVTNNHESFDALVEFAKGYGAKGLAYLAVNEDGTYKSSFAKFMTEDELKALVSAMQGEPGDLLLFAADKNKIVWNVLGALRLELAKELDLLDPNQYNFLWVTEFPLLEWSDEENRFMAMHHPFTMPMEEDWDKIDSDPGSVRAKAYDIVLNGTELGGGSVRIHQDDIQEKMFEVLGFTKERAREQFGFLLDAFKYGVPPHAGLAYGLDRVVMLMVGADSIRDVIAFPKVKDASCLMMEAPAPVDPKQLEDLDIAIVEKRDEE